MADQPLRRLWRWPWPLLVAWGGGWLVVLGARAMQAPSAWALMLGLLPSFWAQAHTGAGWRRAVVLAGLPMSLLAVTGMAAVPPWAWLCAAALLLALYPVQSWADAPVFPTPRQALKELGHPLSWSGGGTVLDAGSGLGHGIVALRLALPGAIIHGVESSWPLVLFSRCRGWRGDFGPRAGWKILQADMWKLSWEGYTLVYLFQRPETMERAWRKAQADMADGTWMASLEFRVPGLTETARLTCPDGRDLWIYRVNRAANSITGPLGR